MTLRRNSLCPCGSGRKVKRCHKEYLTRLANVKQNLFHINHAHKEHNRRAAALVLWKAEAVWHEENPDAPRRHSKEFIAARLAEFDGYTEMSRDAYDKHLRAGVRQMENLAL